VPSTDGTREINDSGKDVAFSMHSFLNHVSFLSTTTSLRSNGKNTYMPRRW
jgi:hypothetical protein